MLHYIYCGGVSSEITIGMQPIVTPLAVPILLHPASFLGHIIPTQY